MVSILALSYFRNRKFKSETTCFANISNTMGHNIVIVQKSKSFEEALYYVKNTI